VLWRYLKTIRRPSDVARYVRGAGLVRYLFFGKRGTIS